MDGDEEARRGKSALERARSRRSGRVRLQGEGSTPRNPLRNEASRGHDRASGTRSDRRKLGSRPEPLVTTGASVGIKAQKLRQRRSLSRENSQRRATVDWSTGKGILSNKSWRAQAERKSKVASGVVTTGHDSALKNNAKSNNPKQGSNRWDFGEDGSVQDSIDPSIISSTVHSVNLFQSNGNDIGGNEEGLFAKWNSKFLGMHELRGERDRTRRTAAESTASASSSVTGPGHRSFFPSFIWLAIFGLFAGVSALVWLLLWVAGLPVGWVTPPVIVLGATLIVLSRPDTLAKFLCGTINVITLRILGLGTRTEIGKVDVLRRRIDNVSLFYDDALIFQVHSVGIFFTSKSIDPFHGSSRPLLTFFVSGVTVNLLHSLVQALLKSNQKEADKDGAAVEASEMDPAQDETSGFGASSTGNVGSSHTREVASRAGRSTSHHSTGGKRHSTAEASEKKYSKEDVILRRIIWLCSFAVVELDKVSFRFLSGQSLVDIELRDLLLSCSKQDRIDAPINSAVPVVDTFIEPRVSASSLSVNVGLSDTALPLFHISKLCASTGVVRYRNKDPIIACACVLRRWLTLSMARGQSVEDVVRNAKTGTKLERAFLGIELVDAFVSPETIEVFARVMQEPEEGSDSMDQFKVEANKAEGLRELSTKNIIELSSKRKKEQHHASQANQQSIDYETGIESEDDLLQPSSDDDGLMGLGGTPKSPFGAPGSPSGSRWGRQGRTDSDALSAGSESWQCQECAMFNAIDDVRCSICDALPNAVPGGVVITGLDQRSDLWQTNKEGDDNGRDDEDDEDEDEEEERGDDGVSKVDSTELLLASLESLIGYAASKLPEECELQVQSILLSLLGSMLIGKHGLSRNVCGALCFQTTVNAVLRNRQEIATPECPLPTRKESIQTSSLTAETKLETAQKGKSTGELYLGRHVDAEASLSFVTLSMHHSNFERLVADHMELRGCLTSVIRRQRHIGKAQSVSDWSLLSVDEIAVTATTNYMIGDLAYGRHRFLEIGVIRGASPVEGEDIKAKAFGTEGAATQVHKADSATLSAPERDLEATADRNTHTPDTGATSNSEEELGNATDQAKPSAEKSGGNDPVMGTKATSGDEDADYSGPGEQWECGNCAHTNAKEHSICALCHAPYVPNGGDTMRNRIEVSKVEDLAFNNSLDSELTAEEETAGFTRVANDTHHHDTRVAVTLIVQKPNVHLEVSFLETFSSIGGLFALTAAKVDKEKPSKMQEVQKDHSDAITRDPTTCDQNISEEGSSKRSSPKHSRGAHSLGSLSAFSSLQGSLTESACSDNSPSFRRRQQRAALQGPSNMQPALLSKIWIPERIGISLLRAISFDVRVEAAALVIAPPKRKQRSVALSRPKQVNPARLVFSLADLACGLSAKHGVHEGMSALGSFDASNDGATPQYLDLALNARVGVAHISQGFEPGELQDRQKLLMAQQQQAAAQAFAQQVKDSLNASPDEEEHDAIQHEASSKQRKLLQTQVLQRQAAAAASKKLFHLLHIVSPFEMAARTSWERYNSTPQGTVFRASCSEGLKVHFFGASWLRLGALLVEYKCEALRLFASDEILSSSAEDLSLRANSTPLSPGSTIATNPLSLRAETNRKRRSSRKHAGLGGTQQQRALSAIKIDAQLNICKINLIVHGNGGLDTHRHSLRLSIPELSMTSKCPTGGSVTLRRVTLGIADDRVCPRKPRFETFCKVTSLTLSGSKTMIAASSGGRVQETNLSVNIGAVRMTQGSGVEFGDALASILQQRKALKEGLAQILKELTNARGLVMSAPLEESSGGSSLLNSSGTTKAGALVNESFQLPPPPPLPTIPSATHMDLTLGDLELCFMHEPGEWEEDPKLLKYVPKQGMGANAQDGDIPLAVIAVQGGMAKFVHDSVQHSRKGLLNLVWELDDCPDRFTADKVHEHGFSFIIGCVVPELAIEHLVFQLRDHRRPLVEAWEISLAKPLDLVLAELRGTPACSSLSSIVLSEAWPHGTIIDPDQVKVLGENGPNPASPGGAVVQGQPRAYSRHPLGIRFNRLPRVSMPIKIYHHTVLSCDKLNVVHGECLSHTMNAFDVALARMLPKSSDKVSPKLGFWDKLRYMYHGLLEVRAKQMSFRLLTLSPWHCDTGLLFKGTNFSAKNVRERNALAADSLASKGGDNARENSSKTTPTKHQRYRFRTKPSESSAEGDNDEDQTSAGGARDVMDWGSFFAQPVSAASHSPNASSTPGSVARDPSGSTSKKAANDTVQPGVPTSGVNAAHAVRVWELFAASLTISTIRDLADLRVEQYTLLTVPRLRFQLSLGWGDDGNLDHYVQLHHGNDIMAMVRDMYKTFRSRGCSLGLKFELGCSARLFKALENEQVYDDAQAACADTPTNNGMKVGRDRTRSELRAAPEDDATDFPSLTICWAAYVAICDIRRALNPPGPPKSPAERPNFGRLLTSLRIGILADQPRILWWEEPSSDAALLAHAESLVTKIEYVRVSPTSTEIALAREEGAQEPPGSQWNPPYGFPPPWNQNALLVQAPNVSGFFIPRFHAEQKLGTPTISSAIRHEGRMYTDASGCGWQYWSAFPAPPSLHTSSAPAPMSVKRDTSKARVGIPEKSAGFESESAKPKAYSKRFVEEPWVSTPALMIKAGKWRLMQAATASVQQQKAYEAALSNPELRGSAGVAEGLGSGNVPIFSLPSDDDPAAEAEDEVFTLVLDEIRLTWSISIRDAVFMVIGSTMYALRQQWKVDERLNEEHGERSSTLPEGSFDESTSTSGFLISPRSRGMQSRVSVSSSVHEESERNNQFDGHFEGPLVDPHGVFAPSQAPGSTMADLLEKSGDPQIPFEPRVVYSDDYFDEDGIVNKEMHEALALDDFVDEELLDYENIEAGATDESFASGPASPRDGKEAKDKRGNLQFLVRLRWAQVQLRSADGRAFITGESAVIRSFRESAEAVMKADGRTSMPGFELVKRTVDVAVRGAQVFIPPADISREHATVWMDLRPPQAAFCFSEKLADYAFSFPEVINHENDNEKKSLNRHDALLFDPDKEKAKVKVKFRPALERTYFEVHEVTYTIIPPEHVGRGKVASKLSLEDAEVPCGMFHIGVPKLDIALSSYQFFNVLSVLRNLLLAMPSPDFTAMITKDVGKTDQVGSGLRWFEDMDRFEVAAEDRGIVRRRLSHGGGGSFDRVSSEDEEYFYDDGDDDGDGDDETIRSGTGSELVGEEDGHSLWEKRHHARSMSLDSADSDDISRHSESDVIANAARSRHARDAREEDGRDHRRSHSFDADAEVRSPRVRSSNDKPSHRATLSDSRALDLKMSSPPGPGHRRRRTASSIDSTGSSSSSTRKANRSLKTRIRSMSGAKHRNLSSAGSIKLRTRRRGLSSGETDHIAIDPMKRLLEVAQEELIKTRNDFKTLTQQINILLGSRKGQSDISLDQSELIYHLDDVVLTLLEESPESEDKNEKGEKRDLPPSAAALLDENFAEEKPTERIRCFLSRLHGSHVFRSDNSTAVHISLQSLRVTDCKPASNSLLPSGQPRDILTGLFTAVNTGRPVPILRIKAETMPHLLVGDFKVNVYSMLQVLLYPGLSSYRLSVFLTWEVTQFLVRYFNSDFDDDKEDVLVPVKTMASARVGLGAAGAGSNADGSGGGDLIGPASLNDVHSAQSPISSNVKSSGLVWVIRSGWILKRGRTDVSWEQGTMFKNFCHLRVKQEPRRRPPNDGMPVEPQVPEVVVLLEYFSGLETRLRFPKRARGSIDVAHIDHVCLTRDHSAPPHAVDMHLIAGTTYTFFFGLDSSDDSEASLERALDWIAAMRPLLGEDVLDPDLAADPYLQSAHCSSISSFTTAVVDKHMMSRGGTIQHAESTSPGAVSPASSGSITAGDSFMKAPEAWGALSGEHADQAYGDAQARDREKGLTGRPGVDGAAEAALTLYDPSSDISDEEQFAIYLMENDARRYVLSNRRASALGLTTTEAMRLAAGEFIDLVRFKYLQVSKIQLSLTTRGIPFFVNRPVQARCEQIIFTHSLFTWQKFFKKLRRQVAKGLVATGGLSLLAGAVGLQRKGAARQQQEQDRQAELQREYQQRNSSNEHNAAARLKAEVMRKRRQFQANLNTFTSSALGSPLSPSDSQTSEPRVHNTDGIPDNEQYVTTQPLTAADVARRQIGASPEKMRTLSFDSVIRVDEDGNPRGGLEDNSDGDDDDNKVFEGVSGGTNSPRSPSATPEGGRKRFMHLFSKKKRTANT